MTLSFERTTAAPVDARADETWVPMRDGASLATDLYLPASSRALPTVLVRLPYDKDGRYTFMAAIAPFFTDRGYAFVVQDVRGKFRSGGQETSTIPYVREVEDGYDTIEWIVSQAWSDGVVGTYGDSYYGWTQWAAVASRHPALRAIVPRVASVDAPTIRFSGDWTRDVPWLYMLDLFATTWLDEHMYVCEVDWSHRPLAEVFDELYRAVGRRSIAADDMVSAPPMASRYDVWRGRHPYDVLDIPVLNEGGWFDCIGPQQMRDHAHLTSNRRTRDLTWLSMDSSDHDSYRLDDVPITASEDHESTEVGLERFLPAYLRGGLEFFDVHLRGKATEIPRVRWHLGHVGWRTADTWPPPGAGRLRLHLSNGERAGADADGGGLSTAADRGRGSARWLHDPGDLVPSSVKDQFAFLAEFPDEREVESRPDVMTFTTDARAEPLDLAGPVDVTLSIESDAPSIAVFVKLLDAAPDGTSRMLLRGQTVVGAPDGRPTELGLGHIAYRLRPGHRLRLHVASSDFPLFLWHPGTDENPWTATSGTVREIELGTNGASSSFLDLTVLT